jgi:hypothetical protein
MVETCGHCGARLEAGADWCPLCYERVGTSQTDPPNLIEATSAPMRTPLSWVRPARSRWQELYGAFVDIATKVLLTLGIATGLALAAFRLEATFYVPALGVAAALVWTVWRQHPA